MSSDRSVNHVGEPFFAEPCPPLPGDPAVSKQIDAHDKLPAYMQMQQRRRSIAIIVCTAAERSGVSRDQLAGIDIVSTTVCMTMNGIPTTEGCQALHDAY